MNTPRSVTLSVVVPCYNEARRLPSSLSQLLHHASSWPFAFEIIVVVERSTDQTAEIATEIASREPAVTVIANPVQRGKGYALRTGVLRSRGAIVLTMDADLSVPLGCIDEFVRYFERHPEADVLLGNRQHQKSQIAVRQRLLRELLGKCFNILVRLVLGGTLRDTQCGFKAYRRPAATAIFSRQTIDGFASDVEILYLAKRLGFEIRDLPVHWSNSPESRVRIVRDTWYMLRDLATVRRRVNAALRSNPPPPTRPKGLSDRSAEDTSRTMSSSRHPGGHEFSGRLK